MSFHNATLLPKKEEIYNQVQEQTFTLDELILCEDVDEDADSWSEVSDRDIERELETISPQFKEHEAEVHELALYLWAESLPRLSIEKLRADTSYDALRDGVWINSLRTTTVIEHMERYIDERDVEPPVYRECRREAREFVHGAIYDKMNPRRENRY